MMNNDSIQVVFKEMLMYNIGTNVDNTFQTLRDETAKEDKFWCR